MNPVLPLLLLLLMGVSIVPFTAGTAAGAQNGGSIAETGHGVQVAESNETAAISRVTVDESVFRAGDTQFVWGTGQNSSTASEYGIDVALSAAVSDEYELCIGSNACEAVPDRSGAQSVSLGNVSQSELRTTFTVRLQRASDGTAVDAATVTVWRIEPDDDLDRDGLDNEREVAVGSSLVLADTDDDGLADERELAVNSDPTAADTDGDGLADGPEVELDTDPTVTDTDGDGLDDAREADIRTDPTVADTDDDGLVDGRELTLGANATVADTDDDGLADGREVALGANLTAVDTDGDGLIDGREADLGSDPTTADTDGDGLADAREVELDTDPTAIDTDGDGLADAREVELDTDPTVADTDDDGLIDGRELGLGSDPAVVDTDDDGVADAREVEVGADPAAADTDGDYIADGTELELGSDPTNTYTPVLYGSVLLGFVLGIGVTVSAIDDGPAEWLPSAVSERIGRGIGSDGPVDDGSSTPGVVRLDSEPDGGSERDSTARDVFERHQDALVTDAERTIRMLEAEGGQMKQSAIVDSTSWSKAKVSRLLSRMDDDSEIVKVPIGRENLICLPEHTPEPAQSTDPGATPSGRLVGTATSG